MAKCKQCGRIHLRSGSEKTGLCRSCRDSVWPDILHRRAEIKQLLLLVRFSQDTETVRESLNRLLEELHHLIRYEKRGIPTTRPEPSEMIERLTRQREQLLHREQQRIAAVNASHQTSLNESVRPESMETSGEGASRGEDRAAQPEDRRRAARIKVGMSSHIEPDGLQGLVRDISRTGVFVQCARTRPVGTQLRLLLRTPRGIVQAYGVVRRRSEGGRNGTGMAVQFLRQIPTLSNWIKESIGRAQKAA